MRNKKPKIDYFKLAVERARKARLEKYKSAKKSGPTLWCVSCGQPLPEMTQEAGYSLDIAE